MSINDIEKLFLIEEAKGGIIAVLFTLGGLALFLIGSIISLIIGCKAYKRLIAN